MVEAVRLSAVSFGGSGAFCGTSTGFCCAEMLVASCNVSLERIYGHDE